MTQFKDKSAKGGEGARQRRAVHLPDPAGRRHPALPAALRPGRRGPAPAPRADPRPRAAVQPPLQEDLPAARALHPQGDREDHRPAGARPRRCRSRRPRRRASSRCSTTRRCQREEDPLRGHRLRHRDPLRRRGQARHLQPADDLLRPHRPRPSPTSRRSTTAGATATSRRTWPTSWWSSSPPSATARSSCSTTRPQLTAILRAGAPSRPPPSRSATLARRLRAGRLRRRAASTGR